jgi:hypothetical protein
MGKQHWLRLLSKGQSHSDRLDDVARRWRWALLKDDTATAGRDQPHRVTGATCEAFAGGAVWKYPSEGGAGRRIVVRAHKAHPVVSSVDKFASTESQGSNGAELAGPDIRPAASSHGQAD